MKNMQHTEQQTVTAHKGNYKKLLIMAILSFIAMYILMYAMADQINNVYPNLNQFYMACLMTMPMVVIELVLMGKMYRNKKLNVILIATCAIGLILFFSLIQSQTAVSDKQFLKGMIPHHAAAILMSEQSKSSDPEIKKLQYEIISSQQQEIRVMKAKLKSLNAQD